jgi:hypothetical protein
MVWRIRKPPFVCMSKGCLSVPTLGSTTATWIVPLGKYGTIEASTNVPILMLNFSTSCVMSTIVAFGLMFKITPFISAT